MKNRNMIRPTNLTVCLLAVAAASCGSGDGATTPESSPTAAPTTAREDSNDEPMPTEPPETTTTKAAPTTTAPVITEPKPAEPPATTATSTTMTEPVNDTIVVPFHTIDPEFPAGFGCDDAIPGFDVAFTNERDERIIVEARFANASRPADDNTNAACAIGSFEGAPALLMAAQLEVPAAELYPLIEIRYPFANGAGNDRYDAAFEMVTSEQAQAGLYRSDIALGPSEVADVEFPVVE